MSGRQVVRHFQAPPPPNSIRLPAGIGSEKAFTPTLPYRPREKGERPKPPDDLTT